MIEIFYDSYKIDYKSSDVFLHFTGNIFGIGCSAFDQNAIKRIRKLKGRNDTKGFILLFASLEQAQEYNIPVLDNKRIFYLINQYLPGNLTVKLFSEDARFRPIAENNTLAVRIPGSQTLRDFIAKIGHPIISTSINKSGEEYCNNLDTLLEKYSDWFDYGLYNQYEKKGQALPSTIIDFSKDSSPKCIREGSIPFSHLKESWEKPLIGFVCIGNICRSPMAETYLTHRIQRENLPFRTASCGLNKSGS